MWGAACLLNNLAIRNKAILKLKLLHKVRLAEITIVNPRQFLSCFTDSTANVVNHLIII